MTMGRDIKDLGRSGADAPSLSQPTASAAEEASSCKHGIANAELADIARRNAGEPTLIVYGDGNWAVLGAADLTYEEAVVFSVPLRLLPSFSAGQADAFGTAAQIAEGDEWFHRLGSDVQDLADNFRRLARVARGDSQQEGL